MGGICPVCNGMENIYVSCKRCGYPLVDLGRYMDYFDQYSAYVEIDDKKKTDGIVNDYKMWKCPHLLYCPHCFAQNIMLINELQ